MRKYLKRKLIGLMSSVEDGLEVLPELSMDEAMELLAEIQNCILHIGTEIEDAGDDPQGKLIPALEDFSDTIYNLGQSLLAGDDASNVLDKARQEGMELNASLEENIKLQYEIAFLPYKASMWDALESVYLAAEKSEDCNAVVMPIPYYNVNKNGTVFSEHYEADQFPPYVTITDYHGYQLEKTCPDAIFIHNPYDNYNVVTQVYKEYFTNELIKYTDHLVFIPYKVQRYTERDHFCTTIGIRNSWRIFVQSEIIRKIYLKFYEPQKVVALGSPKVDKVIEMERNKPAIPEEWRGALEGKKIILYNTHLVNIMVHGAELIQKLNYVFSVFRHRDDVAILWRPHPLCIETIKSMNPSILQDYQKVIKEFQTLTNGVYDDTPDIHRAIAISDAYLGDWSSVVPMYGVTLKPILITDILAGKESIIDQDMGSMRASSVCTQNESLYFTSALDNRLFKYEGESKSTKVVGSLDYTVNRSIWKVRFLQCYNHKFLLSGGNESLCHVIYEPDAQGNTIVARGGRSLPVSEMIGSYAWKDRVYIITKTMQDFGYIQMEEKTFVDGTDLVCSPEMQSSGWRHQSIQDFSSSSHHLYLLCEGNNLLIHFNPEYNRVEAVELDIPSRKIIKMTQEHEDFFFLTEEMDVFKMEGYGSTCRCLCSLKEYASNTGQVNKLIKRGPWLAVLPEKEGAALSVSLKTGKICTVNPPEGLNQNFQGSWMNLSEFAGDQREADNSLYLGRGDKLLKLDLESGTWITVEIPLPTEFDEESYRRSVFEHEVYEDRLSSVYREERCTLTQYLDLMVRGEDVKYQHRKEEFGEMFCNLDGTCGLKIWEYVKELL